MAMTSAMTKPEKPSTSAARNSVKVKWAKRAPIITPSTTFAGTRIDGGAAPEIRPDSSNPALASIGPSISPAGTLSHSRA